MPTNAVKVVDTSGAGDSFNGAYLAARLRGHNPEAAAREGLALAAKVVAQPGAVIPR
jgi:2-dehydro-3-deoxygluconokinase